MNTKAIFIIMTLLGLLALLSGCNKEEKYKEKYNLAIEQVITLENNHLLQEKKIDNTLIDRGDVGIVVYKNGEYIRLLYKISGEEFDSYYQKDQDGNYKPYPNTKESLNKIEKYLKEYDYIENIGLK